MCFPHTRQPRCKRDWFHAERINNEVQNTENGLSRFPKTGQEINSEFERVCVSKYQRPMKRVHEECGVTTPQLTFARGRAFFHSEVLALLLERQPPNPELMLHQPPGGPKKEQEAERTFFLRLYRLIQEDEKACGSVLRKYQMQSVATLIISKE
jgi:hypothetical protein